MAGVSDYIMSNRLMSKVLAMVSEEASVSPILEILFAEEGDEICMRDVRRYACADEHLSFFSLVMRARAVREVAIGYKRGGAEVILNPESKHEPMTWGQGDILIVLGEMSDGPVPDISMPGMQEADQEGDQEGDHPRRSEGAHGSHDGSAISDNGKKRVVSAKAAKRERRSRKVD